MTSRSVAILRAAGGVSVLAVLVWRLGAGPFMAGLRAIDAWSLAAAVLITAAATACAAWRWCLVARRLGADLSMPQAISAYYRSQLVNLTVPGGVLGDVDRALGHGRRTGRVSIAARAVVWERCAGQVVQALATLALLALLASPVRPVAAGLAVAVGAVAALAGALITLCRRSEGPRSEAPRSETRSHAWIGARPTGRRDVQPGRLAPRPTRLEDPAWRRMWRVAGSDVRLAVLGRDCPAIVIASLLAVSGHVAILMIAAHLADPGIRPGQALPLVLLVLAASAIPLHVLGWGPREGVAAWVFAAAGLGAAAGVETATVYGILALAACLPGAVVLLFGWGRRRLAPKPPSPTVPLPQGIPSAVASSEVVSSLPRPAAAVRGDAHG